MNARKFIPYMMRQTAANSWNLMQRTIHGLRPEEKVHSVFHAESVLITRNASPIVRGQGHTHVIEEIRYMNGDVVKPDFV